MRTEFKIKYFKKSLIILMLCFGVGISHAQSQNEVSVYAQGLFSRLDYKVMGNNNSNNMGNGLGIGVHYAYYLNTNWSLGSGLEYQYYEGTAKIESLQDFHPAVDMEGENFDFRYRAVNYSEEQNASYLNIPLMLQYETSGNIRFFLAAGAKAGFKIKASYEAEASSLVTSGYYSQYDAELKAPLFAGFGNFGKYKTQKSPLNLKTTYIASAESGVKLLLAGERSFYMGLFLDYGLNDISESEGKDVIAYNTQNPPSFIGNSLLESTSKTTSQRYIDEVKTLAFGLKIRYAFGL